MKSIFRMVIVLTILSGTGAGTLAGVKIMTEEKIEEQQMKFEKAPAVQSILAESPVDPVENRFKVAKGDGTFITVFPGVVEERKVMAIEAFGKGFSGDIGLMVGIDLETGAITRARVTTHTETPGFGSKAKESTRFVSQFDDRPFDPSLSVRGDGGGIDAISGATITSRAVCVAAQEAGRLFKSIEKELKVKAQSL